MFHEIIESCKVLFFNITTSPNWVALTVSPLRSQVGFCKRVKPGKFRLVFQKHGDRRRLIIVVGSKSSKIQQQYQHKRKTRGWGCSSRKKSFWTCRRETERESVYPYIGVVTPSFTIGGGSGSGEGGRSLMRLPLQ